VITVIDTYPGGELDIVAKEGIVSGTVEVTLRFVSGDAWNSVVLTLRPEQAAQIVEKLQEVIEREASSKEAA